VTALLVAAGAAIGAPLRYLVDQLIQGWHDTVFPAGTFTVNVIGSLVLGGVAGAVHAGAPTWLATLVGTGFCGALTTFSTFGYETIRLLEEGGTLEAGLNVAAGVGVGLLACVVGWWVGAAMI
jgi:CrcB protein